MLACFSFGKCGKSAICLADLGAPVQDRKDKLETYSIIYTFEAESWKNEPKTGTVWLLGHASGQHRKKDDWSAMYLEMWNTNKT